MLFREPRSALMAERTTAKDTLQRIHHGSRVGLLLYHLLYMGIFIARVPRASAIKSPCIFGHTMDNRLHKEGYGGMLSHKIFEFIPSEVHFQTHLWFSNDIMRYPDFWC